MVGGSFVGYTRSTRQWWSPVERLLMEMKLDQRPIYFVSSNMHSFVNVLSGTATTPRARAEAVRPRIDHARPRR